MYVVGLTVVDKNDVQQYSYERLQYIGDVRWAIIADIMGTMDV